MKGYLDKTYSARYATANNGREYRIWDNRPGHKDPKGWNPAAPDNCHICGRPPEICCKHGSGQYGWINGRRVRFDFEVPYYSEEDKKLLSEAGWIT